MAQKDNRTIAALSGLSILLVVIGHSALPPEAGARVAAVDPLYAAFNAFVLWLYTFHGKMLHAVAGFLLLRATLRSGARPYPPTPEFLLGKAKRLLIPYAAISSLVYPVKALLSKHAMHPVALSFVDYLRNLVLPWNNAIVFFWFLPTLFMQFVLARSVLRTRSSRLYDAALMLASLLLWALCPQENREGPGAVFNIAGALHNFIFFAGGFYACKYGLMERVHGFLPVGPIALLLSVVGFVWLTWIPFVYALLGFIGMAFSLALASSRLQPALATIGDVSFDIYLFSWFPQVIVRVLVFQLLGANVWLAIALSIGAAMLVPLVVMEVRKRFVSPRLAFLFGA
jgi:peptidoglycan/LPS O-acetylase OafA/YrhL